MIAMIPLGSPLLTPKALRGAAAGVARPGEARATRAGTLRATALCFALFVTAYAGLWAAFWPALESARTAVVEAVRNAAFAAGVATFATAFATHYRPRLAVATAPLCAVLGGVFAGGLALAIEQRYPGLAVQSIVLTSAVFLVLLGGYATGLIRVTARFRAVVFAATSVVALAYLLSFALWFVELRLPVVHGAGWGGVGWAAFVCLVASLNLAVDFQRIDAIETRAAPRFMQWYVALGTIVTFVWLYITVLRLLRRLRAAGA